VIKRCGQACIAGQKGATRSLIAANFIEDTNYRREFGGWETAAIKLHNSVDTTISGNLIRGVYHQMQGAFGIWMDYANQGTRITRNIIYDTEAETIFLEMNHGPALIDNNVLVGQGLKSNSEATIIAHNLLVDSWYRYQPDTRRRSSYYKPHTTEPIGRKTGTAKDERWYNNIFIRRGLDDVKNAPGYDSDHNVFFEGAKAGSFGDEHSVADPFATGFIHRDRPLGVTIEFFVNNKPFGLECPWVDAELVGVFSTTGQTIEDRHGNPIKVSTDLNGKKYKQPVPGPLADLGQGRNKVVWEFEKYSTK
jgi:parallel beta-helix repeat protein